MHPLRKKRLLIIVIISAVLSLAVGLVMYALQQNINLFYSPTQIVNGEAPYRTNIRAGGMVMEDTLQRDQNSLSVSFSVTDFQHQLTVHYQGILPDLFREGQGVIAQGQLNDKGELEATQVLAKHDENYMPPEITEVLDVSYQKTNTP